MKLVKMKLVLDSLKGRLGEIVETFVSRSVDICHAQKTRFKRKSE